MTTIRVLQFTSFSLATHDFAIVPVMATAQTIAEVGGRKVEHSEQDVPPGMVDALGFYPRELLHERRPANAREHLLLLGFRPARSACVVASGLGAAASLLAAATKPFRPDAVSSPRVPRTPPSARTRT